MLLFYTNLHFDSASSCATQIDHITDHLWYTRIHPLRPRSSSFYTNSPNNSELQAVITVLHPLVLFRQTPISTFQIPSFHFFRASITPCVSFVIVTKENCARTLTLKIFSRFSTLAPHSRFLSISTVIMILRIYRANGITIFEIVAKNYDIITSGIIITAFLNITEYNIFAKTIIFNNCGILVVCCFKNDRF